MEKRVLRLIIATKAVMISLLFGVIGKMYAYDFSAVCETGQTLYYRITNANNHYVELTYPGRIDYNGWSGYTKPTGNIILPENIQYNDVTYSVTSISHYAFSGCSDLTGNLTIPNSVITIGRNAFSGCSGFTGSLTIPNSVTSIGSAAFHGCSGFNGNLTIPNSVTTIGKNVFSDCSGFTGSLTIPNSVTTIGEYAFYWCSGFTGSLTIPGSVTTIGNLAFCGCSGLTGCLIIPNSVISIGSYAFYGCIGFVGNLIIPNSVTTIGYDAFYGCSGLIGRLTIGNSVTTIGNYAFENCSGLTEIMMLGTIPPSLGSNVFFPYNCPIYVLYESLNDYKNAWNWYSSRIFPWLQKSISGYGTDDNNWAFLASPLLDSIAPTTVDNLITETAYDLYQFSPSDTLGEWQNYKAHTDDFSLVNGQGYLYANENEVNIIFKGEFNEDVTKEVNLVYDANDERKCFNLVGNPFPCNAYLNKDYYVLSADGSGINSNPISANTPIPPCTAVFVKAEGDGETVVFTRVSP